MASGARIVLYRIYFVELLRFTSDGVGIDFLILSLSLVISS